MASQQQIKRRIGSVKNTRQITKAMELVAASKMRKAQSNAFKGRDYALLANQLLTRLRELTDVSKHPLYEVRTKPKARLHIVVTSDRGLAGAYDPNVLKAFAKEVTDDRNAGIASHVITIGRKAGNFTSKLEHVQVLGSYTNFPEHPTANDLRPLLFTIVKAFLKGSAAKSAQSVLGLDPAYANDQLSSETAQVEPTPNGTEETENKDLPAVDLVDIIYTDFKSSIVQEVAIGRLLPAAFSDVTISEELENASFEPSAEAVLNGVTMRLIEAQLYQALLESVASEQSSRMMAMKNASDNAGDLIEDLTLAFNTARQAAITQELAEITGGAEAIK